MLQSKITEKNSILIFSDISSINKLLIKNLLNYNLKVYLITKNDKKDLMNSYSNNDVNIIKNIKELIRNKTNINYLIYFNKFKDKEYENKNKFIKSLNKNINLYKYINKIFKTKSTFLINGLNNFNLKSIDEDYIYKKFQELKSFGAVIFYSDLITPKYEDFYISDLYEVLKNIVLNKNINLRCNEFFYPLLDEDLVTLIIKILFSISYFGKAVFIIGKKIKLNRLVEIIGVDIKSLNIKNRNTNIFKYDEEIIIKKRPKIILNRVYKELLKDKEKRKKYKDGFVTKVKDYFNKIKETLLDKTSKLILGIIIFLFLFPVGSCLLSLSFLHLSNFFYENDFFYLSKYSTNMSLFFSKCSNKISNGLKQIYLLDNYYNIFTKPTLVLELQSEAYREYLSILEKLILIVKSFNNKERLNFSDINSISIDMNDLYEDISFLEAEYLSDKDNEILRKFVIFDNSETNKLKNLSYKFGDILKNLTLLLGYEGERKYLIVLQDNSYLRPTGGVIEKFVFLILHNFSIASLLIEDKYELNNKILGSFEKPVVVKKYFKDSYTNLDKFNWNPDISYSALDVSNFINKEFKTKIDGTLFINQNFINELVNEMDKVNKGILINDKGLKIIKKIYEGFNQKDIQIYFSDQGLGNNHLKTDLEKKILKEDCIANCFLDYFSLIETSEGEVSSSVSRMAKVSIYFQEKVLKGRFDFYVKNTGKKDYKVYLRFFAGNETSFSSVKVESVDEEKYLIPDIIAGKKTKEAGVYLELKPNELRKISFIWENRLLIDFEKKGEYRLFLSKQSGVKNYPVDLFLNLPDGVDFKTDNKDCLTENKDFRYNALPSGDLKARIFW